MGIPALPLIGVVQWLCAGDFAIFQVLVWGSILGKRAKHSIVHIYLQRECQNLDKHAPMKSKTVTIHPASPWYTPEVHEAKKTRRIAERKWPASQLTTHKEIYITERNRVSKIITKNNPSRVFTSVWMPYFEKTCLLKSLTVKMMMIFATQWCHFLW